MIKIICILKDQQVTWAKSHFWKLHFEDDAVGDVSDPLQGAVPEAEDFNRLETTTPGGCYFFKEGKERAHIRTSANLGGKNAIRYNYASLTPSRDGLNL